MAEGCPLPAAVQNTSATLHHTHIHTTVAASLALLCRSCGCGWLQASSSLPTVCSCFHVFVQSLHSSTSQGGTARGVTKRNICHLVTDLLAPSHSLLVCPSLALFLSVLQDPFPGSRPPLESVFFTLWVPGLVLGLTLEGGHGKW